MFEFACPPCVVEAEVATVDRVSGVQTVLITGGAGFIGCALSQRLMDPHFRVVAADVLHPQVHPVPVRPAALPDGVELIPFDVTAEGAWGALLAVVQPDVIVHLAAETGTGQSLSEASRHGLVNVVGTTRMLDALYRSEHRPKHLILTSSRAVYGDGAWVGNDGAMRYPGARRRSMLEASRWDHVDSNGQPMTAVASVAGITETHPTNVYAATKLAQEDILRSWCAATETKLSILRLQNVYGPGQSVTNSYTGVLTYFARQATSGGVIDIYEDGNIVRDFVFIDDVASALHAAINHPPETDRLVDIGSGAATTIGDVALMMASMANAPDPQISGRFREGDVRAASCSIDAARLELGYAPVVSVDAGVRRLLDWVG